MGFIYCETRWLLCYRL